ncbi:unnamed protein product [Vitrella brassicaformis CCMP3155]|uniref:Acyltransferase n=1 Tax=Vitrella brassicaformis (strain CCMP3155) TaxID=1169540 RepID=A0A0G4G952_VITBC|nr:unnamed protein product [Vitrella brassicaformis CCMP3155]|mmetsp:Transcript_26836/g.66833  ORF Transcript_26836/g.66833 Transcript_26836/m.66833 type:complete len:351 (-) Transcript_26836:1672-2724(-)|eukprot:CEM25103.1 unnamed protein product [Vitrella brassicaformis CCMP3155]
MGSDNQDKDGWPTFALLVVYVHGVYMLSFLIMPTLLLMSIISSWRYLLLPPWIAYFLWTFDRSEYRLGRPWPWLSQHAWPLQALRRYFPFTIHVPPSLAKTPDPKTGTGEADDHPPRTKKKGPYIIAIHPHGSTSDYRIICDGLLTDHIDFGFRENAESEGFPYRTLAASSLFWFPIAREGALWTGCVDAGRRTAECVLSHGLSILVVPGGQREMLMTQCGKEIIYLKKRLGFVRLAVRHGVALVPCYVFGASDTYFTCRLLEKLREWISERLKLTIPLICGAPLLMPRRIPMHMVFGDPVSPPSIERREERSEEQRVAEMHAAYVEAVQRLFDEHKGKFGYGDRQLIVL